MLHWPDEADHDLWPFALQHAVFLWNHLPQRDSLQSPIELFSGEVVDHHKLFKRLHVWGAPVYVLDPKLADGKKIPKWSPRSRQGMYLGFSPKHSSLISNVMNIQTGHIGAEYHVVVDDLFTTVPNVDCGGLYDPVTFDSERWQKLLSSGYEKHFDEEDFANSGRRNLPILHDDWLTGPERRVRRVRRASRDARRLRQLHLRQSEERQHRNLRNRHLALRNTGGGNEVIAENVPTIHFDDSSNDSTFLPSDTGENDDLSVAEGAEAIEEDPGEANAPIQPRRTVRIQEPTNLRRSQRNKFPNQRNQGDEWVNLASSTKKKITYGRINHQFLAGLNWGNMLDTLQSNEFSRMWKQEGSAYYDKATNTQDYVHPMILAAKANSEDTPSWHEAMNGPLREGYWKAAETEYEALQHKDAWDVVEREDWMNVLPGTWAFRCKRYPDGSVRKLKARFCARGDKQIQGVDFNDTWSPVVNWNTVRLLLILSQVLGLATQQVDYTTAFLHAPIDDEVYVDMPRGFKEEGKVLKLKRSLYGLRQSPRNFFNHLHSKLEGIGFKAMTDVDPCLFISDKCICLVYVDDTLFFSPKSEYIDEAITAMRESGGIELEREESVAGFLGVHIERDERNGTIKLTQTGLTKRIIEALNTTKTKQTPAVSEPLAIDADGDPPDGLYNYASVVGMLLYLQGHSRPDITFAVSQVARFIHGHRRSHEVALERIGQYLNGTKEQGLVLKPTDEFSMECYCDADFAGMWATEDRTSQESVRSRAGFVICICGCPIVWKSQLMVPIACSTMQAEYNALSLAMKDVIPLQELFKTVGKSVGIAEEHTTTFRTTVWEDNQGAQKLANLHPGQSTPRSKHYGVRVHWFRSHLAPNRTTVKYIETQKQKADILTKGLTKEKFESIRKLLCGW